MKDTISRKDSKKTRGALTSTIITRVSKATEGRLEAFRKAQGLESTAAAVRRVFKEAGL
jgi:hypothetical protein